MKVRKHDPSKTFPRFSTRMKGMMTPQNQERDKTEKYAQGNGKYRSLKAYTKMMNRGS